MKSYFKYSLFLFKKHGIKGNKIFYVICTSNLIAVLQSYKWAGVTLRFSNHSSRECSASSEIIMFWWSATSASSNYLGRQLYVSKNLCFKLGENPAQRILWWIVQMWKESTITANWALTKYYGPFTLWTTTTFSLSHKTEHTE